MTQEEYKEYRSHLDAIREMSAKDGIKFYFELKDEMTDSIMAVREEDSRNIAEKMVNDLLKENGFKQSENKQ